MEFFAVADRQAAVGAVVLPGDKIRQTGTAVFVFLAGKKAESQAERSQYGPEARFVNSGLYKQFYSPERIPLYPMAFYTEDWTKASFYFMIMSSSGEEC
jgi:hypothetical protein